MAKKKFYAIKVGKQTGVFDNWNVCKEYVSGYSGVIYKSFDKEQDAYDYLNESDNQITKNKDIPALETIGTFAFVDGSFNPTTNVYGYGGFLSHNGVIHYIQGSDNDEEMATMRNVAGEIIGSIAGIQKAIELGITEITIYYDYMGIECWATKSWKTNKKGTVAYAEFIDSVKNKITLHFVHVKGHTGIEGNEIADKLAKQAVGL